MSDERPIVFCVFIFIFRLETLQENNWIRTISVAVIIIFFMESVIPKVLDHMITAVFKVLSEQLRDTLTSAFERRLTIGDFTGMDQHRCRACTNTFDLLLYASLSLKQT